MEENLVVGWKRTLAVGRKRTLVVMRNFSSRTLVVRDGREL